MDDGDDDVDDSDDNNSNDDKTALFMSPLTILFSINSQP